MLQAVIFDLDGVIVDSHPAHLRAWKAFFRSLGKDLPDQELSFVLDGRRREEILRHFLGDLTDDQVRDYGARKDALFREFAPRLKTIQGFPKFLDALASAVLPVAVASSASGGRVTHTLEQLGLKQLFRVVVTGDDVSNGKPDPAIFHLAAQRLCVDPENILVCEDAVSGVEAAKRAGMKCLAIAPNGRGPLLKDAGASRVLPDFTSACLEDLRGLFAVAASPRRV
jgi:beta-phosphoglucomutase